MAVNNLASKVQKLKQKTSVLQDTFLLRDFIHDRLYAEPGGYFTR